MKAKKLNNRQNSIVDDKRDEDCLLASTYTSVKIHISLISL